MMISPKSAGQKIAGLAHYKSDMATEKITQKMRSMN